MVHKAALNDVYPLEGSCILVTGQGSSSLPCATVKVDDLTVATSLRADRKTARCGRRRPQIEETGNRRVHANTPIKPHEARH